jgi:hypothetical protein
MYDSEKIIEFKFCNHSCMIFLQSFMKRNLFLCDLPLKNAGLLKSISNNAIGLWTEINWLNKVVYFYCYIELQNESRIMPIVGIDFHSAQLGLYEEINENMNFLFISPILLEISKFLKNYISNLIEQKVPIETCIE